jgi:hypothetical protein
VITTPVILTSSATPARGGELAPALVVEPFWPDLADELYVRSARRHLLILLGRLQRPASHL